MPHNAALASPGRRKAAFLTDTTGIILTWQVGRKGKLLVSAVVAENLKQSVFLLAQFGALWIKLPACLVKLGHLAFSCKYQELSNGCLFYYFS